MNTQASTRNAELGFDPDALREKYRVERDKRIRTDGNSQYQEVKGEFAHYIEDPYIESYIYLPPLEEQQYIPKEKYAHAPEILAHSRAIGEKYDLYTNACSQTEVTQMRWDDDASRWIISTNRGDRMRARFV